jgi:hypothetical protein
MQGLTATKLTLILRKFQCFLRMFELLEGNVRTASYYGSFMLMANLDQEVRCSGRVIGTHCTPGRVICFSRSRKCISCVPVCLLHTYQLCLELSTLWLRKCISWFPRSLLLVCHTDTRPNV